MQTNSTVKAGIYDRIETTRDFKRYASGDLIPAGSSGVIVECYNDPESYAVDIDIPDDSLVGGFDVENLILKPDDFIVARRHTRSEPAPNAT